MNSFFSGEVRAMTENVDCKNELKKIMDVKPDPKGLVIIFYNSYNEHPHLTLHSTKKDSRTIARAFGSLGFATITISAVNEDRMSEAINALASFKKYPSECKILAIYFSGQGSRNGFLLGSDNKDFSLEETIIKRLNKNHYSDVSDAVTEANILVFIDACEGPVTNEDLPPENMLVAYAASEGQVTRENEHGGIWTQALASKLQESRNEKKSLENILEDVRQAMPYDTRPCVWDKHEVGKRLYL
jgi:hypothetical protein